MNKKKRIYLNLDSQRRELDSRLLFISECLKNDYEVVLSSKSNLIRNFNKLKTGVVILKGFGPKQWKILKNGLKYNFKFCGWDEEAILFSHPIHITDDKIRIDKKVLDKIIYYFSWGDESEKIIRKTYPSYSKKFVKTGNPRIDILKKKYHDYYKENSKKIRNRFGKNILFTTKFNRTNNLAGRPWMKIMKERSVIDTKEKENHQFRSTQIQEKNFPFFLKLIETVSKKHNDYSIIIRPHPNEDKKIYFELEKKFKNINVCTDHQSTNNYIYATDCLISSNCATLIESYILEKPSINYLPIKDEDYEFKPTSILSKAIRNEKDVLDLLDQKPFNFQNKNSDDLNKISNYYYNFTSGSSSQNIISLLNSIEIEYKNEADKYQNKFFFYALKTKKILSDFYGRLSNREVFNVISSKRGGLTIDELKNKLNKIAKTDEPNDFKIKQILPGIFLFS